MRLMCAYASAECEDVKYELWERPSGWSAPKWEKDDRPGIRDRNPFANLPYVINRPTGEVVIGSNPVYLYLGRLFGLNGETGAEKLANEQVLFQIHGLFIEVIDLVYPFRMNKDEHTFRRAAKKHFAVGVLVHYEKLESWLRQWHGAFFVVPSGPCTADFLVWEMLDQHEVMAGKLDLASPLAGYAFLRAFHTRFRGLPRLSRYFDSEDADLPINNQMAYVK